MKTVVSFQTIGTNIFTIILRQALSTFHALSLVNKPDGGVANIAQEFFTFDSAQYTFILWRIEQSQYTHPISQAFGAYTPGLSTSS